MLVLDEPLALSSLKSFRRDEELHMSGSSQFSERTFSAVLPLLKGNITVIDLRQESHGFIKGIPISWYAEENRSNEGMTREALQAKEEKQLSDLIAQEEVQVRSILEKTAGIITHAKDHSFMPEEIETEKALVARLGLSYYRLPVLDHHRPEESVVAQFVSFVERLSANTWLHFHCRGGKGRSTTFMILYAILKNNKKATLEEISARQVQLGGSDLFSISQEEEKAWKKEAAIERKQFIERFYEQYRA